jgi:hypothetical protein
LEGKAEVIFDAPFVINSEAESIKKILGAVLRAGADRAQPFHPIWL